jgi:hypothetical protein
MGSDQSVLKIRYIDPDGIVQYIYGITPFIGVLHHEEFFLSRVPPLEGLMGMMTIFL